MERPIDLKLWLYDSWPIRSLRVNYRMTGEDTAETTVTIEGAKGAKILLWRTLEPLLEVGVDYNSVARLNYTTQNEVRLWREFEKEHAADLAELQRLKQKLGQS